MKIHEHDKIVIQNFFDELMNKYNKDEDMRLREAVRMIESEIDEMVVKN